MPRLESTILNIKCASFFPIMSGQTVMTRLYRPERPHGGLSGTSCPRRFDLALAAHDVGGALVASWPGRFNPGVRVVELEAELIHMLIFCISLVGGGAWQLQSVPFLRSLSPSLALKSSCSLYPLLFIPALV